MIHMQYDEFMTECGIRFNDSKYQIILTDDPEKVTCKNCLRCLEIK